MKAHQLREQLEKLAKEIDQLSVPDDKKSELHSLIDGIDAQYVQPGAVDEREDLNEQIDEAIARFEVEHPGVAGILRNILMTLSNIGV